MNRASPGRENDVPRELLTNKLQEVIVWKAINRNKEGNRGVMIGNRELGKGTEEGDREA